MDTENNKAHIYIIYVYDICFQMGTFKHIYPWKQTRRTEKQVIVHYFDGETTEPCLTKHNILWRDDKN